MATLPPAFADLEPYAAWSLPTERERFAKRLASSMEELESFYDAALPGSTTPSRSWISSTSTRCPPTRAG